MVSAIWWPSIGSFFSSQIDSKHENYLRSGGLLLEAFFVPNQSETRSLSTVWWHPAGCLFVSDPCETRKVYAVWWRAVGGLSNLKPMRNANGICDLLALCWKPSSSQTDAKHEWHLRSGDLLSETFVVSNRWETRMESAIW